MRIFILTLCLCLIANTAFGIQLTKKQFDNIDILHKALKKVDVNFVGLNGSRKNMQVIGIGDSQAQGVIDSLDIDALIAADATAKQEVEDTKEEQKLLKMLDRQSIKAKIKAIKNQP